MADLIVGGVFFAGLAFALRHTYRHFSSGSCSCSAGGGEAISACGGSCPHCKGNA